MVVKNFFDLQFFAKKVNLTKKSDTYSNSTSSRIIYGLAGNDSIYNRADNVTVSGGAGKDTLISYGASHVSLSGDAGNDYYFSIANSYSSSAYVTLSGGAGNDTISNYGHSSVVNGDAGNDYIRNDGRDSTISGGDGNDTIDSSGNNSTISGGAGNDYIFSNYLNYSSSVSSSSYYVTLNGGKGDDIINFEGDNHILQYASGDGNDIVLGFNSKDTLHITKGSYKTKVSGNDVIVTVGDGVITLKGAAGQKLSIKNSKGKVTKKTFSESSALFAEDNFATADNLSEITKNDLTPTAGENLETFDADKLAFKTSLTSGLDNN